MKRFFHPVSQFIPQSAIVGKLIVTDPWFGRLDLVIDQLFCLREMLASLPGVFAENNDCVILLIRQVGEMFCVHAGAVKTRFFQNTYDTRGDGSPCYSRREDVPVRVKYPADSFCCLGPDGVVGTDEENRWHAVV